MWRIDFQPSFFGEPLDASRKSCDAEPHRLLVVDDFAPFRASLCQFFKNCDAVTVVGEAHDGQAAIEMALRLVPHVVIMDVQMPRVNGIEATRHIKRALPRTHVIGLSVQDDSLTRDAMQSVGTSAFVTKECAHTLPAVIAKITAAPLGN